MRASPVSKHNPVPWWVGDGLTAVCGHGWNRYDLNDMYSLKMQTQVANEKSFSQVMFDLDVKGIDWQGQVSTPMLACAVLHNTRVLVPGHSCAGRARSGGR